jgi:hypothetical protein
VTKRVCHDLLARAVVVTEGDGDFRKWHITSQSDVRSDVGCRGLSGIVTNGPNRSFMTQLRHGRFRIFAAQLAIAPFRWSTFLGLMA